MINLTNHILAAVSTVTLLTISDVTVTLPQQAVGLKQSCGMKYSRDPFRSSAEQSSMPTVLN